MKIVIYQTSDIHGYIYPTDYLSEQSLGLLKIGSYILEDEKNYDASLKIDCGDMIQGSPLANYLHMQVLGNVLLDGMEKIGYDAYVIGNHEFNYGKAYLHCAYQKIEEKILNANIEGLDLKTKPYQIFNFSGFKVAVIGLTTAFIPNWEQSKNIDGIRFHNPVEVYAKYEKELKEQADLIVVAYHGGFECSLDEQMKSTEKQTKENQGSEMIRRFKSIDVLLSGHQHRGFVTMVDDVSLDEQMKSTEKQTKENQGSEMIRRFKSIDVLLSGHQHRGFVTMVDDVVCAQPHHNGMSFVKLVIDTVTMAKTVELIEVKHLNLPLNQELEQCYRIHQENCLNYLAQPIGHINQSMLISDVFSARLKGHMFMNFIHQVQLEVSGAQLSVASLFDQAIGFDQSISLKDVMLNYPYPNTLKVIRLKGKKIKEAIEKSATYFMLEDGNVSINEVFVKPKVQNYNYDFFGGLQYWIDLRRSFGNRVVKMLFEGEEMNLDADYEVVLSNYRLSNTSVYPCYENAECIKEIDMDISTILVDYLHSHPDVEITEKNNFKIIY